MDYLGSKRSSRDFQPNCAISFFSSTFNTPYTYRKIRCDGHCSTFWENFLELIKAWDCPLYFEFWSGHNLGVHNLQGTLDGADSISCLQALDSWQTDRHRVLVVTSHQCLPYPIDNTVPVSEAVCQGELFAVIQEESVDLPLTLGCCLSPNFSLTWQKKSKY